MNFSHLTRSLGFRQTMLLTAGCFVLIALGVTGVTLVSRKYSRQGTRQTETLTGQFLPGLVTLARLQDAAQHLKSITYQFALARDEAAMTVQQQAFQASSAQLTRSVAELQLLAHDEPTQQLIAAFAADVESYRERAQKFQTELGAGDFEKAMATLDQQVGPAQQKIERELDALNEQFFELSHDAGTRTTALLVQSDRFGLLSTIVLAGFTLLCLGLTLAATRALLAQMERQNAERQRAHDTLEKRVEERTEELASSLSVLNATLDSTADGILAVQLSGEVLCHNRKFAAMWGVPAEVLETRSSRAVITFLASQMRDPAQYIRRIDEHRGTPEADTFDVLELADGRIFERYVKPQQVGPDIVGVVINFRDITERQRAQAELDLAHRRLLETSRQAGMAEVATSVLHNVGNVLNSVNVSCSVAADKVRKSRIRSVAKTAGLLQAHAGDLAGFFTRDPSGQKLPDFLSSLAGRLAEEQAEVLKELQSLARNIEHIKDIVSMQQNYAKVSGVTETVNVTELVEDGLRMNNGSLLRHDVHVVRDFAEVPPITVEKHKVLQILVNLMRNAKHACDETGRDDKQMTVRVSSGHDRVRVAVIDNGVGIPPENLTRIFAHGFTTKKDGHGFGLHGAVLAAQEIGGSLQAQSLGPGNGATFTLELPVRPPDALVTKAPRP